MVGFVHCRLHQLLNGLHSGHRCCVHRPEVVRRETAGHRSNVLIGYVKGLYGLRDGRREATGEDKDLLEERQEGVR